MRPRERLLRRADYLRCYRTGRRRVGALVILYFAPNELGHARMGITATRKVGNSVIRHRLKRRIKEIYRRWPGRRVAEGAESLARQVDPATRSRVAASTPVTGGLGALDVVVHLKPEARACEFADLARDVVSQLQGIVGRKDAGARRKAP